MRKGIVARALDKARHGLLLQEGLNRLGRLGLLMRPYVVYLEKDPDVGEEPAALESISVRELTPADLPALYALPHHDVPNHDYDRRFEAGDVSCAAFDGERLVAFTWAKLKEFPGISGGPPLRSLKPDEAYLYDAYTHPSYRGRGIVPVLRKHLYRILAARGHSRCYSVTLMFNRSARRFKEKLRARAIERRLAVRLFRRFHVDIGLSQPRQQLP